MSETTLERIVLDAAMQDGEWTGTRDMDIAEHAALAAVKVVVNRARWSAAETELRAKAQHISARDITIACGTLREFVDWLLAEFPEAKE